MSNHWPFIKIASDPDRFNGVTIPVRLVAGVTELQGGGCCIRMLDGHVVNLHRVTRETITEAMEDALEGEASPIGGDAK